MVDDAEDILVAGMTNDSFMRTAKDSLAGASSPGVKSTVASGAGFAAVAGTIAVAAGGTLAAAGAVFGSMTFRRERLLFSMQISSRPLETQRVHVGKTVLYSWHFVLYVSRLMTDVPKWTQIGSL